MIFYVVFLKLFFQVEQFAEITATEMADWRSGGVSIVDTLSSGMFLVS
jgi:hypothetical protein